MKLTEDYTLENDGICWILRYDHENQDQINPKTGLPTHTKMVTYHANLQQALDKMADNLLKPSSDLVELINSVRVVHELISKFKPLKSL